MKILALQLKRVGDLVLTTPTLAALRAQLPDALLGLAVCDGCESLLPGLPGIDTHLVYRQKAGNARLWLRMLTESWDVCLDFTGNDRSALFTFLSKASRRIAFDAVQKTPARALFYNRFVASPVREHHTIDHYLHLLEPLGVTATATAPVLHLPPQAVERATALRNEAGIGEPFAIVHPGSARPEKYWLAERWAAVIDHLQHAGRLACVLTGGTATYERDHLATVLRHCARPAPNLAGRTDLLTLAALVQQAALVLSVDSAPMHFAAAFGTPQIALFGPTNPFHWRPRHAHTAVVVAGRPGVAHDFFPRSKGAPMREISTEQVCNAMDAVLDISNG